MKSKAFLIILLVLFLAGCGPAAVPPTAALLPTNPPSPTASECLAGSHVKQLSSGGEQRSYILHIPPSYAPGKPAALVLGFHGNNGRPEQFEAYSGFSPLADRAGFIIAYPLGSGDHPTWQAWQGGKDVQFARDLIDRISVLCSIDPARIYATGHSLGGGMANRLACDLSERIAAIGPVSGAYQDAEHCSPSRPVPVAAVHGAADSIIFYNGIPPNGNSPGAYFTISTPIPQWASAWAQRNGCDARPSTFLRQDPVNGQQWGHCRAKADVILYTIRDGEHGWPLPNADFDAAQTLWDFFRQHPLVTSGDS